MRGREQGKGQGWGQAWALGSASRGGQREEVKKLATGPTSLGHSSVQLGSRGRWGWAPSSQAKRCGGRSHESCRSLFLLPKSQLVKGHPSP